MYLYKEEKTMYKNYIGERLKLLRKTCGYSQQNIANALGIDRTTYSSYERGITIPDAELCFALSRIYNISPLDLLDAESRVFSDSGNNKSIFDSFDKEDDTFERITKLSKDERQLICHFRSLTNEQRLEFIEKLNDSKD